MTTTVKRRLLYRNYLLTTILVQMMPIREDHNRILNRTKTKQSQFYFVSIYIIKVNWKELNTVSVVLSLITVLSKYCC